MMLDYISVNSSIIARWLNPDDPLQKVLRRRKSYLCIVLRMGMTSQSKRQLKVSLKLSNMFVGDWRMIRWIKRCSSFPTNSSGVRQLRSTMHAAGWIGGSVSCITFLLYSDCIHRRYLSPIQRAELMLSSQSVRSRLPSSRIVDVMQEGFE